MKEDDTAIQWTEKDPSAIKPSAVSHKVYTLTEPTDNIKKFWKAANTELHQYYEKGIITSKGNIAPNQEYEKVLDIIIICLFQCIRDTINNDGTVELEAKQEQLVQITSIESIFKATIRTLRSLHIKLDLNSVLCILQGCINEGALQISEEYERRHRT